MTKLVLLSVVINGSLRRYAVTSDFKKQTLKHFNLIKENLSLCFEFLSHFLYIAHFSAPAVHGFLRLLYTFWDTQYKKKSLNKSEEHFGNSFLCFLRRCDVSVAQPRGFLLFGTRFLLKMSQVFHFFNYILCNP